MQIAEIVREALNRRASDIHFVCGLPIRIRIDGSLCDFDKHVLTKQDCEEYGRQLAGDEIAAVLSGGELDLADTFDGIRCRINLFSQQRCVSAALRILSDRIPPFEKLELPQTVITFADFPRGIVLITGETGSGKSTTLAALLDRINHTRPAHIITLEDPIEYIYTPDQCIVNQREIGTDTESYSSGLKAVLREDPDVIMIGEMRGLDTIETALTAAETGHLVFATLHTNSAADSVDRIVNVFPAERQQQIRLQLSMTLRAVLSQQLLPKKDGGRVPACEIMIVNSAIRNLIREAKTAQIPNFIATSAAEGNISMDNALLQLVRVGTIGTEKALAAAHDTAYLRKSINAMAAVPSAGNLSRQAVHR